MAATARIVAILLCAVVAFPAWGAEEEEKVSDAKVYLLATTNQGGFQKIPMQSMEACQTAAIAIYDTGDDYSGPSVYIYCVSDDGKVWAFDRWNREE